MWFFRKHGTIAKVLFSVVSLLLGVIEGDSIEASIGDNDDATENKISKKKEPKSKRKPKALNQQQRQSFHPNSYSNHCQHKPIILRLLMN